MRRPINRATLSEGELTLTVEMTFSRPTDAAPCELPLSGALLVLLPLGRGYHRTQG
ncbi:hypothetical protein HD597_007599 [Nonomuraea thailandensis]|uniref:Uncharacterized protein n=1 Tax=Nonomuraea thailandensis TaxID=1188745 RepID=A0A9X2K5L2_9ACTN|nr:hypothetical protein [Nonomuraea thailandensis]MCP2360579.1 hypothetical protein [Nonomuraea thailandensis]